MGALHYFSSNYYFACTEDTYEHNHSLFSYTITPVPENFDESVSKEVLMARDTRHVTHTALMNFDILSTYHFSHSVFMSTVVETLYRILMDKCNDFCRQYHMQSFEQVVKRIQIY